MLYRAISHGFYSGVLYNPNEPKTSENFQSPLVKSVLSDLTIGANLHVDRSKFRSLNHCVDEAGAIIMFDNSTQLDCKKEGSIFADYLVFIYRAE